MPTFFFFLHVEKKYNKKVETKNTKNLPHKADKNIPLIR